MELDANTGLTGLIISMVLVPVLDVILPRFSSVAVKRLVSVVASALAGFGIAAGQANGMPDIDALAGASMAVYSLVNLTYGITSAVGLSGEIKARNSGG